MREFQNKSLLQDREFEKKLLCQDRFGIKWCRDQDYRSKHGFGAI